MEINITTWNMAHWSHKKHNEKSWKYFTDNLETDIFLFQEAYPNYNILEKDKIVWNEIGNTKPWGSGIYAPNNKIKEFGFTNNFFGAVTAAEIEFKNNESLIFISLYGLMEKISNVVYAIPNLHRIFSDLTGILESRNTKHRIIIGGDFNASLQIDEIQTGNSHKAFFDRLSEFGLINCFEGFYDDFVQTHRHSRSKKPWQNDYFFISKKLLPKLKECKVIDNEFIREYSDHNPVMIKLEL